MARSKVFLNFIILTICFKTVFNIEYYDLNSCSLICNCDSYQNYRRVSCCGKNINTLDDLGAPYNVEILDLSRNQFTSLGNSAFQDYPYIVNLTISYNSITTLYLDTFSSLKNLLIIDLSHNQLEEFNNRIFEENTKLVSVDLSWNRFMLLQEDRPILISKSIEKLSLKNSQLNHIYQTFFKSLPNLKKLDLSQNLLITLFNKQFSYLSKLTFIDLRGNQWQCDRDLERTITFLKENNVKVVNDQCMREEPIKEAPKFERMQMAPDSSSSYSQKISIDDQVVIPKKQFIPFFDDIFPTKRKTIEFPRLSPRFQLEDRFDQCSKKLERLQDQYNELEASRLSTSDMYFIFFIGVAMGVIGIMISISCCICIHKMCRKSLSRRRSVVVREEPARRSNSPFMSTVLERPRERRRRQQYERIHHPVIQNQSNNANITNNSTNPGSFIAIDSPENPDNVIIAVRPETPPPAYFDIVAKK